MMRSRPAFVVVAAIVAGGHLRVDRSVQGGNGAREPFTMRVVARGLANPFQIVWGSDDHLWVTERTAGRITRVRPADGAQTVAITIDGILRDEDGNGLLGMALDPGLRRGTGNDFVYVVHTYDADPSPQTLDRRTKVLRLTYDSQTHTLGSPRDVPTKLPAGNDHQGGRVVFGPDRKLYVTIGDQGANQLANFCNPNHAQHLPTAAQVQARDWSMYEGKILRIDQVHLFNTPQFANPGTSVGAADFGQIRSTINPARQLQFALKLEF
jgi:PQQ-dependent dehydrogenase (s-GDH family)